MTSRVLILAHKSSGNWPTTFQFLSLHPASSSPFFLTSLYCPAFQSCPGSQPWLLTSLLPETSFITDTHNAHSPVSFSFLPKSQVSDTIPMVPLSCFICLQSSYHSVAYFIIGCQLVFTHWSPSTSWGKNILQYTLNKQLLKHHIS